MKHLYLLVCLISFSTLAQKSQIIRINLKDQNTKAPISAATILVKNTALAGITNDQGVAAIETYRSAVMK